MERLTRPLSSYLEVNPLHVVFVAAVSLSSREDLSVDFFPVVLDEIYAGGHFPIKTEKKSFNLHNKGLSQSLLLSWVGVRKLPEGPSSIISGKTLCL